MEGLRKRTSAAYLKLERIKTQWGGRTKGLNADGTFKLERILSRASRASFVVRWEGWGWGSEWDSVVAKSDIDSATVEEFEEEECAAAEPPAKAPAVPFTEQLTADETEEQHEWRVADCGARRRRTRTRLRAMRLRAAVRGRCRSLSSRRCTGASAASRRSS
jgi:hypothetical protein